MRLSKILDSGTPIFDSAPKNQERKAVLPRLQENPTPPVTSFKAPADNTDHQTATHQAEARPAVVYQSTAHPIATNQTSARQTAAHQTAINESIESLYNSLPDAIYSAAKQLEIPIPSNKNLVLQKAMKAMDRIITLIPAYDDKNEMLSLARNTANDLMMVISLDSNFAKSIRRSPKSELAFHSHCINTALIAMDLAKGLDNIECSPNEIGMAAILHDIGIPAMNLDFVWQETNDKNFIKHVAKGVELLTKLKAPDIIRTMVAQHHERLDGTGYPNGISGKDFLVCSQILSLSEGFERIACEHHHASDTTGSSLENYTQKILHNYRKAFNPDILKAFISMRGFYPDGTMVELTNRSICMVLKQNEGFPLKPVVQIVIDSAGNHPDTAKVIDLRAANHLAIIRIVTEDRRQTHSL